MLITFKSYSSRKKSSGNAEKEQCKPSTNVVAAEHNSNSADTRSHNQSKLVTASSQLSVYGTAENYPPEKADNCSSDSSVTCSTQDQVSSISQTDSMCNLQTSLTTDDSQSTSSSQSNSSTSDTAQSPGKSPNGSSASSRQPITNLTLPLFKKDGRTWLHKTSAISKYGAENLIGQKFKKDSRIWLHKTSKKRRLFTISCDKLREVEMEGCQPDIHKTSIASSLGDNLPALPQDASKAELFFTDEIECGDQQSSVPLQVMNLIE